mmetsp:Transcript_12111/g.31930  ORF Transcript_12111/g.31930 Transcript_12111/m.31930 type:complete len:517 (-) Transcript_12111:17-1567(-)
MVSRLELVEELEAAAAPSPSDALVELAGLLTATRLKRLTYKCDEGRLIVSEYVALKHQRDDAADVCRICHGPGTVRPAEADDETGERLLRDTCLCRGSIGCVHEECLVRWYETAGLPPDPRCPTCRGQFRNEGGLVLSRRLVAHRRSQAAARTTPETPTDLARRRHAEITQASALWRRCDYKGAKKAFETALSEIRRAHDDEATLRANIYYVTATLNLALVELAMGHLDAAERGARWAQEALSGSDQELRATHNLALILDERGLVAEAAALYEDVHSTRRDQLGAAHPDSLRTACNLGRCYNRLGNTDAAVALLTETRSAALASLGDADELTLAASHNLSETRAARGEYAEARQLALASLDARRRVCGEQHIHTLRSTLDLARLLRADPNGADDEAIQLCASAATGLEKLLGKNHTQTARARNLLEQWRGAPPPAAPTAQVDDGRERVALVETLDVADEQKSAVLDVLVAALRERGVAELVVPLARDDAHRERKWDAVIGVADLDGGTRFAHRLNI